MPKETIHTRDGSFDPQVGWSRDKYVQVGMETQNSAPLVSQLYESEGGLLRLARGCRESDIGELLAELADAPTSDVEHKVLTHLGRQLLGVFLDVGTFSGIWADLTREEINHFIRVLRRARDQAYGRDE
jgi:hypothetical protein